MSYCEDDTIVQEFSLILIIPLGSFWITWISACNLIIQGM